MSFTADYEHFGEVVTHELKPGGEDIDVEEANKEEFVRLMTEWRLLRGAFVQLVTGPAHWRDRWSFLHSSRYSCHCHGTLGSAFFLLEPSHHLSTPVAHVSLPPRRHQPTDGDADPRVLRDYPAEGDCRLRRARAGLSPIRDDGIRPRRLEATHGVQGIQPGLAVRAVALGDCRLIWQRPPSDLSPVLHRFLTASAGGLPGSAGKRWPAEVLRPASGRR